LPIDFKDGAVNSIVVCNKEKDVMGRYVTIHPTEAAKSIESDDIQDIGNDSSAYAQRIRILNANRKGYLVIGVISCSSLKKSSAGRLYIRGTIEDNTGTATFLAFGKELIGDKIKSKDAKITKLRGILRDGNLVKANIRNHGKDRDGKIDPTILTIENAEAITQISENDKQIDAWDNNWGDESQDNKGNPEDGRESTE
jgi:DNA polymerase III alpha subunit